MVVPGKVQTLAVRRVDARGAWLDAGAEEVFLPQREVPEEVIPGASLEVFVWRDDGALVATRQKPRAELGDFALLRVSAVNPVGAFLDWGLPKELLVPYSEQPEKMQVGRSYLVKVCLDDRERLVGTARIERCLAEGPHPFRGGEEVALVIWRFTGLGAVVIIDGSYEGLLYRDEVRSSMRVGERLPGRIARVRDDGKLDVTLRRGAADEITAARRALLEALQAEGSLPLHDKSPPEEIARRLGGMSKKLFKKAVGGLLKSGEIDLEEDGIRLRKG